LYEKFEDIKGVIRNRKSKKDRQHNGQDKKYKQQNKFMVNIILKMVEPSDYFQDEIPPVIKV
jgi:hypothetical protein